MIKHVIITDRSLSDIPEHPERLVISATDFIANTGNLDFRKTKKLKAINLCTNYDYLSKGYYVSLLAEARGLRCVPGVADVVRLNWKRNYEASLPELQELIDRDYTEAAEEPLSRTYSIYFGRSETGELEAVARRLFDLFRFPLMTMTLRCGNKGQWEIKSVAPFTISSIPSSKLPVFHDSLDRFTGAAWRAQAGKKTERFWIAILHNPEEQLPPSNKGALNRFLKVGKEMGLFVELITRQDYSCLLEYDALFIRETTAINHHTFRFASKAESEDIPCIDDTQSIIRCCNKVFQHEVLDSHGISVPKTLVIDRKFDKSFTSQLEYPLVLKIPDGAFSRGIIKVNKVSDLRPAASELLKKSEIILCQEFLVSEYDWRIGVLDGVPLYACKYYMAKDHWQIINHTAKNRSGREGESMTVAVEDVPEGVIQTAVKAAKLMGSGLYGVDLKQTERGVVVMEVNDNPNLDLNVEDKILGDELYRRIFGKLVRMIEE